MHIVQIIPALQEGGVERGTVEMNRELVKRGHRSTIISAGGRLVEQILMDGGEHHLIDVRSKNPLSTPSRVGALERLLERLHPSVVHARSRVPAWLYKLGTPERHPFVTTVHGFNSINLYSKVMTSGKRVICVSEAIKDYLLKHYQVDPKKLRVIPRGVDLTYFSPGAACLGRVKSLIDRHRLQSRQVITTVGRITGLKDHETFIRAIAQLRKTHPRAKGLIVGSASADKQDLEKRLRQLVSELSLDGHVDFVGHCQDMREIYALSHAVVCGSKKPESFGRTVTEALAMGRPVVATRLGAHVETLPHGKFGFLVPPENPAALASRLADLGALDLEHARQYVTQRYSLERMVDETIATYEELQPAPVRRAAFLSPA